MASLPSPTQVAGHHSAIYEAYYCQVDPNGYGTVGAMEAARFLKRSGLSDVVLSRVWDLSDPNGRGFLDKSGLFVALKLVALAQAGRDINISNIGLDMPPPKMGDPPPIPRPVKPPPPSNTPLITSLPPSVAGDWSVKPAEREKYDKLFDSLQPLNGMIPGNKVKGVLMDSKLPLETLGKIWDLADIDKDGMLDRHEFIVAMHLVYKALEKYAIPNVLPPELSKRKTATPTPSVGGGGAPMIPPQPRDGMKPPVPPQPMMQQPIMQQPIMQQPIMQQPIMQQPMMQQPIMQQPLMQQQPPPPVAAVAKPVAAAPAADVTPWVVTSDDRAKFDALFIKSDIDRDGYVSGMEIKDVFLQSGVPQIKLAHIWALCDIRQSGKLNNEQFALAMWLVARCLKGMEPPAGLAPEMVPPSFRNQKPSVDGLVENNNTPYSNPELDMISKDIEELAREKLALETDIAQKEADIKIKSGEIKSLQSELDTLAATLKQLENQKGEAQKRLNDLKAQRSTIDVELEDMRALLKDQQEKVDKLRTQATEQAETVAAQEAELASRREQLEGLRQEEQRLEKQRDDSSKKLERLTSNLQDTQLNISQAKAMITQLQEQTRQMNDAIVACDTALDGGDLNSVPDTALRITPEFRDPNYTRVGMVNGDTTTPTQQNGFGDNNADPFSSQNGTSTNGFASDPFKNDPFKSAGSDAFGSSDPFGAAFPVKANDGFSSDPFGSSAFDSINTVKADPFDAFGDNKSAPEKSPMDTQGDKDQFGCDPFAVLHAPTRDSSQAPGRPTSPSPALPPKKSKQPPPRPAPPRPQPPKSGSDPFGAPTAASDPFGGSAGGGGFADFANFEAKFSSSDNKPTNTNNNSATSSSTATSKTTSKVGGGGRLDFTDDPFRDYRYEDPFNIVDPFADDNGNDATALGGRQSVPLPPSGDPFFGGASGRASAPISTAASKKLPSEDSQLAWAAQESLRIEMQRKQRQLQEQADLELAIALSKSEANNNDGKKH